jgi:hypothetical protein
MLRSTPLKRTAFKRKPKKPMSKEAREYVSRAMMLACMACNRGPSQEPHHPKGHAFGTGTSLKSSDFFVIPLCCKCHEEYHQKGRTEWEAKYGTQQSLVDKTQRTLGFKP